MISVVPVSTTSINWSALFKLTGPILGRHINASIDSRNIPLTLASYLSVLAEFQYQGTDPLLAQREAGSLLRHISVGLLIIADEDTKFLLASEGRVAIVDCDDKNVFLATANLEDWRTTVLSMSTARATNEMRVLNSQLLAAFDTLGLTLIFENYRRHSDLGRPGVLLISKK